MLEDKKGISKEDKEELKKWVKNELKRLKKENIYQYHSCLKENNKICNEMLANYPVYMIKRLKFKIDKKKIKYLSKAIAVFNHRENYKNGKGDDEALTDFDLYEIEQKYCKLNDTLIEEINDLNLKYGFICDVEESKHAKSFLAILKRKLKNYIISPEKNTENKEDLDLSKININNAHEYLDTLQSKREQHETDFYVGGTDQTDERKRMSFKEYREARGPFITGTELFQNIKENEQSLPCVEDIKQNSPIISRLVDKIIKLDEGSKFLDKIIGQKEAKEKISDVLRGSIFSSNEKPVTFLFVGPTGVGKTETAKQIAKYLFENKPYIMDMSLMHDDAFINNIVGSPRGYLGSDKLTQFENYILNNENGGVVVLDEFEKADDSVRKLFLPVFDEGRISNGIKSYDLSNFIFVCTTNAGNVKKSKTTGFGTDVVENNRKSNEFIVDKEVLQKDFSPELLARMEVVEFKNLTKEDYIAIADDYINNMIKRGIIKLGHFEDIEIISDKEVANYFADKAIAEGGGARTVISLINKILSKKLIKIASINNDSGFERIYLKIDKNDEISVDVELKTKNINSTYTEDSIVK